MERFDQWLGSFPWLNERGLPCIISADLDGLCCGLFQQEHLEWRVVGTYDGSRLAMWESPEAIDWQRLVFLDVEILRSDARSIGNHLLASDIDDVARLRTEFPNCANPNLWRGINVNDSFQQKYPYSTLPLIIAAHLLRDPEYRVPEAWLALILQTDSSFTNAAMYQANALKWLELMGMGEDESSIRRLCEILRRLPVQIALHLVERVQGWAKEAGYGVMQRSCRFDPSDSENLARAERLLARVRSETNSGSTLPLERKPVVVETFKTAKLPIDSKGRRQSSFAAASAGRAVSLAATARSDEGLSFTLPNPASVAPLLR